MVFEHDGVFVDLFYAAYAGTDISGDALCVRNIGVYACVLDCFGGGDHRVHVEQVKSAYLTGARLCLRLKNP